MSVQPGSWTAADVSAYLTAGVPPAQVRAMLAAFAHPHQFEQAGGNWPVPRPPAPALPVGQWRLLSGTVQYPGHLAAWEHAPLVLYGRGDPTVLGQAGVALVGDQVGAYGAAVAQAATRDVRVPVIAPGAPPWAFAHPRAVIVAPGGADLVTGPVADAVLAGGGAIVSARPFGTPAAPGAHQLAAALAAVCVILEGRGRGGATAAAWTAFALQRTVAVALPKPGMVVPGALVPAALAAGPGAPAADLGAWGAPDQPWARRRPLAHIVAHDRDELATQVALAAALSSAHPS